MALMIEIEKEPKGAEGASDPRAAAGKALAKALKSGDGALIADAFDELRACCDEAAMDEEDDDE